MVTILYGNSNSKISGLTDIQMAKLRKILSYHVDFATARFIPNPFNRVKYCIDKKGNFATGLLDRVIKFTTDNNIESWMDSRTANLTKEPIRLSRTFKPEMTVIPYLDQSVALERLTKYMRGTCSMPTGTGKSHVITMLLQKTGLRTLIVVPTLELKYQLTETLTNAFTSMEGITVENIDSNALKKATDYDCLIIDECHRSAAKTYRDLNNKSWNGIRWRYCFSATPFRNDVEEQLLYEGVAGSTVYELTYARSVEKGYIVPVEAYYFELPQTETDSTVYTGVYKDLVTNNKFRNTFIADLLRALFTDHKHCLCLVKEIKHGEELERLTGIPFANGQDEDSRHWIKAFASGKLKCLIGTEGILGEGVDTKPCEYVIIAGLGKARSALMQKVGRAVRRYADKESAKVIIFKDKSHKWTLTHFKTQCKIIETEYNTVPVKLELV